MSLIFNKLTSEIRTFTLIQFLGAMIGSIASLYFFAMQSIELPNSTISTRLASILTLLIIGLCDFFIHRNAGYLTTNKWSDSLNEKIPVQRYEEFKLDHYTTKLVVPMVMTIFAIVLSYVFFASTSTQDVSVQNIILILLWLLSATVFASGAKLGKIGWRFE